MKINKHVFDLAEYVPTSKKGPGKITPKFIVMHYTAGYTTEGDVHTLAKSDRKASAHLVLGRDGKLVQIVPCNERAWHAGPSKYGAYSDLNQHSIGIEICNAGWLRKLSNGNYQDQYGYQIRPDGKFVHGNRCLRSAPETWHHEYHPRLPKGEYAWEPFYEPQLDVLDEVVKTLLKEYPTIEYIVSHEEIDTRKWKTDPGPVFPMRRYLKLLEDRGDGADGTHVGRRYRVSATVLNVRENAGTQYRIKDSLKAGMIVTEQHASGEWKLVEYDRYGYIDSGWVHSGYLEPA